VVDAFLNDKISFLKMPEVIERCMQDIAFVQKPTLEEYVNTDEQTRLLAQELI